MNRIRLVLLLLLLISCHSSKKMVSDDRNRGTIVYIIRYDVEELLRKEISNNDKNIFFYIKEEGYRTFRISIGRSKSKFAANFVSKTNRKLFLNDKFYPVIFDLDFIFASKHNLRNNEYIIQQGYSIKFEKGGDIIESGEISFAK